MLTERQTSVLKEIIEEYIKTAQPVSSFDICEHLNCSSATVRNEMAYLEELGFLEKSHISSGRTPSEKGYRYYVDNIMTPKNMAKEEARELQKVFRNTALEVSDAIKKSMEIVSELTNYTVIVLGEYSKENRLIQIQLVPIQEKKAVALIITDRGHVQNQHVLIPDNISMHEVEKAIEIMNKLLVGTPIDKVNEKLEFEIKPIISQYVKQHELLYNAFYKAFSDMTKVKDIHLSGITNFLKQPEFNDVEKIKNIISKFEDKELISRIDTNEQDIKIYIGTESNIDDDLTVITTSYNTNGEKGTIAIIGPKRMEYERVVALLEYIKKHIDN